MTPLRQRMTEDMGVRNLSPLTIKLYIDAVVKFSKFFNKSPALLGFGRRPRFGGTRIHW
jgi:integrase/recombinase XerD